ncbi:MAG: DUF1304 domain-containing protein [Gemmatimonadota bacterium]|nr:DUF1304 domain-containing protein [Gemmatimonadota bacterium]
MAFRILADVLVAIIALLHLGFLVLEMFFWDHHVGRQLFRLEPEFASQSAPLAANQGLYNGFLAAGLLWGVLGARTDVSIFFLCCVVVAGIYGGLSVKRSILYLQALPGLVALAAVLLAR